jgi:hypothetical protein
MLLGLTPCHACDPIPCLLSVSSLTVAGVEAGMHACDPIPCLLSGGQFLTDTSVNSAETLKAERGTSVCEVVLQHQNAAPKQRVSALHKIAVYGARFQQKFTLEDAIGSHACSLEANTRVTNGIPLGSSLLLPVDTVYCIQTLKATTGGRRSGGCGGR